MKIYSYLLFRIYHFYKDSKYENGNYTLSTSIVSTLLISIHVLTIYFLLRINGIPLIELNFGIITGCMGFFWAVNYFLFVRNESFLHYNFTKDKKGGYFIIGYLLLTTFIVVYTAQLHRKQVLESPRCANVSRLCPAQVLRSSGTQRLLYVFNNKYQFPVL